ncbi:LacI family DNA-binding transcriptional regulator [Streptacidiphilus sp. P02-A3a]|uniref:LacI family DNA-binding transcriptional regulator n=1 Tax=Streptacidiphilus sp. P02-A3a TaxID=2704468 RepID=UPI0015F8779E|nr:LacI family DNA-binding transcriptional regulator [Streptacidiphilus sp. P02-A3a]QMU71235.1 LacI family DNA-binding transcriptional regulator [Streptacidiphilus sp. P02-A3a]
MHRPPTMADVARLAGVSHQTVSRVLGGHPNVRDTTRAGVQRAIAELGYRPNSSARALVTRRTHTLGVVAFDTTLFGPASTLAGIQQAARADGYLTSTVSLRRLNRETLTEALEHLGDWGVDGAVVIAPRQDAVAVLSAARWAFPLVTVEGGGSADVPGVGVDQRLGARLVTGHLLRAGHRTVRHVAGPQDWLEAQSRLDGWRSALEDAGAEVPPPLFGDWSPLSGYRAGQQLAGQVGVPDGGGTPLTAVFVANDQMALGVLRAFREAGVRVPEDVAVAGFDDIPEAEYFAPPLTTVRQDFEALGRASIGLLLDRMQGALPEEPHLLVAPELIVRSSTTPRP